MLGDMDTEGNGLGWAVMLAALGSCGELQALTSYIAAVRNALHSSPMLQIALKVQDRTSNCSYQRGGLLAIISTCTGRTGSLRPQQHLPCSLAESRVPRLETAQAAKAHATNT